jgi:hypothetical protein
VTWSVHHSPVNGQHHVIPDDDMRAHEPSLSCWCEPTDEGDAIFAHNSADRREQYERGTRKTS